MRHRRNVSERQEAVIPSAFFPDFGKLIDDKLAEVRDKIGGAWADLWAPIWDGWPLWWSYGVFGLILLGCFAVGFFLQFKWARLALGVVVLTATGWLFGRTTMHSEMKAKLDEERARRKR
jgi:hypothetical protein